MIDRTTSTAGRRSRSAALVCACALALGLGACADDDGDDGAGTGAGATTAEGYLNAVPIEGQKKGGTLRIRSAEAFQHQDPGSAYFQLDYMFLFAVHRSLYYYEPDDSETAVPDLADGPPTVSSDNKTVTVKLKKGIKYGTVKDTPIDGQEVKAADVKYAFERGLKRTVLNQYFTVYFGSIAGSDGANGGPISGITTPDDYTIEFKLDEPVGSTLAKALVMPITMPVPKSYAAQFDAKRPNKYETDPTLQAFSGPYMISAYEPGRSMTLVRNPNWDASTDTRPAYLDRIEWTLNVDPNVAGRQILNGTGLANGDTPAADVVQRFVEEAPERISFSPLGNRWVPMNTQHGPFRDINVRKALIAATDRRAMQLTRGGQVAGDIATHFLPPGIPGFEEAGGAKGHGVDYLAKPTGDPALAASYMRKAGFASGKYSGPRITMASSNDSPGKDSALVVRRALESLGFEVRQRSLDQSAFYDLCQTLADLRKIDICMNFGWLPDFIDPFAMLNANFNGDAIIAQGNNNPSLQDDPKINKAMNDAALIADDEERAKAWGAVDRMLVDAAVAIPWFWDKTPNIVAKDVHGVVASWNATWDLSYMSLK